VRNLLLVLACGCTVVDPFDASDPSESEVVSLSVIPPCPTGQWCLETPPASAAGIRMNEVWAFDEDDVFAVGHFGTILRRVNGNDWYAMSSGTTAHLTAVWGTSPSDVWVGGTTSTLLHYDGSSWSQISTSLSNIDSISGSGPSDVWFVGGGGAMHWDGSDFTTAFGGATLLSVSASGSNDVWISGESVYVRHYNGTSWSTHSPPLVPLQVGSTFKAVFARTPDDVWAAGTVLRSETMRWNGSSWRVYGTDVKGALLRSISGQSANDVWGVGNIRVAHFDGGTTWTTETPFGTSGVTLWAITTVPGHAWIVGSNGLIAHRAL